MVIFLDTYALIEIDSGNAEYKRYVISPTEAITTIFNLAEVHFYYLKNFGQEEADAILRLVKPIVIEIDDRIITDANKLKLVNLKKRLSFADCIGYATARKFGAKFVTGDYAFKGLENVEFVV
ncbi:PIN domain-containing protein [Candidatus Woesearchaeota archaeon]|nr:PIN domain-containing protein [Candidatus Woesearchaeota archaeon]